MAQEQPGNFAEQIVCPNCAGSSPAGASFCAHCGQPIRAAGRFCSTCGTQLRPDASFCPACGTAVPPVQQPSATPTQQAQQPVEPLGPLVRQPRLAPTSAAPFAGAEQVSLWFTGTGLEALGWGLLYIVLAILIIPTGWGVAALARWFVRSLQFSDGTHAQFEGRGGQIWGYFILLFVLNVVLNVVLNLIPFFGFLVFQLIAIRINLAIIRWFFQNLELEPGGFLDFTGSYWPLVGWDLLLLVSFFSIIGWAWVLAALARWYCRNIYLEGFQVAFCRRRLGLPLARHRSDSRKHAHHNYSLDGRMVHAMGRE